MIWRLKGNQQLEERDKQLEEKDKQLEEKDKQLEEKDKQLEEKDQQLEYLTDDNARYKLQNSQLFFKIEQLILLSKSMHTLVAQHTVSHVSPNQSHASSQFLSPATAPPTTPAPYLTVAQEKEQHAANENPIAPEPNTPEIYSRPCRARPDGYSDKRGLNDHINRTHSTLHKVWICHDVIGGNSGFPGTCKCCISKKQYSAYQNAVRQ